MCCRLETRLPFAMVLPVVQWCSKLGNGAEWYFQHFTREKCGKYSNCFAYRVPTPLHSHYHLISANFYTFPRLSPERRSTMTCFCLCVCNGRIFTECRIMNTLPRFHLHTTFLLVNTTKILIRQF